jgi:hypothetical protein
LLVLRRQLAQLEHDAVAAGAALAGALDLIAAFGGRTVKGYPEDGDSVPAGFLDHGEYRPRRSWGSRGIAWPAGIVGS